MTLPRPSAFSIAVLTVGLLIGGTGGAIAAGQIGTNQIRNGAVTTSKLHGNAVTSPKIDNGAVVKADLAKSARGAQVIQYVASGENIGIQNVQTVQLPGTWTSTKLANSSWAVTLFRKAGTTSVSFPLGQAATAGEGTGDGFIVYINGTVAKVQLSTPSYAAITTIRITRTVPTSREDGTAARGSGSSPHTATR